MRSTLVPVSKPRSKWAPRSSRTRSGLPHSKGEGGAGSGGGGMCGRTTASIAAKAPPGGHAVSPIRPPGRHRRASSAAASGRRAKATPKVDAITSKAPEGRPQPSASPTRNSMPSPARSARRFASSTMAGAMSTPVTRAPICAMRRAVQPVPVAMSSARSPGRTASRTSRCSMESACASRSRS